MSSAVLDQAEAARGRTANGFLLDAGLVLLLLAGVLASGSLTLLAEAWRSGLTLVRELWSATIGHKTDRAGWQHYEFGVGKLEQAGNLAVALAFLVAGLWLAGQAAGAMAAGAAGPAPFALAIAAAAYAVVTLRAGLRLLALRAAAATRESLAVEARGFAALLLVQLALTVAVLSKDPLVALGADLLGAAFIGLRMALRGIGLLWHAVSDPIDYPLGAEEEDRIAQVLHAQGIQPNDIVDLRCRRAAGHLIVELDLDLPEAWSCAEARQHLAGLQRRLRAGFAGLDVVIRLHGPAR